MTDFGDYQLQHLLATGGMAELFVAHHKHTGDRVVVKRLLAHMERQPDMVELFITEADIGMLLEHDHIVRVLAAGEANGQYYLAMEYVEGPDVASLLAQARVVGADVPLPVAMRIGIDALRGLHAAHTLVSPQGTPFGLVHRDISPDNLFVTTAGLTKVSDFGIAKLANIEGRTAAGLIKGKITYMSPEQVDGRPLDGRADAFGLALVLMQVLTGERPFGPRPGESELELYTRVRKGRAPKMRKIAPHLPAPVAKVLDRALRRTRWLRHKDCAVFADRLEAAADKAGRLGTHADVAAFIRALAKGRAPR